MTADELNRSIYEKLNPGVFTPRAGQHRQTITIPDYANNPAESLRVIETRWPQFVLVVRGSEWVGARESFVTLTTEPSMRDDVVFYGEGDTHARRVAEVLDEALSDD